MIKYLTGTDKLKCRDLWEEAFPDDSEQFCDYYFKEKLKDNRILAIIEEETPHKDDKSIQIDNAQSNQTENDQSRQIENSLSDQIKNNNSAQVEAMIHLNPYNLMVKGRPWQINYLVGVATRKEKRHQGYMRRLLLQMLADLHQEKAPFCFLMPAKEAIYRPFGFTYIFCQPQFALRDNHALLKKTVSKPSPTGGLIFYEDALSEAARWMEGWMSEHYQVYAQRDQAYLLRLAAEIASEDGILELLYDKGQVAGISAQWGLNRKEQRLLYGGEPYVYEKKAPKPAIMARIVSLEEFVRVICLSEKTAAQSVEMTISLRLFDPLIAENNGDWLWHLNKKNSWLERTESIHSADLSLTIDQLTAWLFGYGIPESAMPYADIVEPLRNVFLDEVV